MRREFTFNFNKKLTFNRYIRRGYSCLIEAVLVILIAVSYTSESVAQESFGAKPDSVFSQLYNFRVLSADSIIKSEIRQQPDSALWNLLSANVAWIEILAGNIDDTYWNDEFSTRIRKAKDNLKRTGLRENDKLFYYIIVHAFKTRHELLGGNYLTAASDLNTCIDQITRSFGKEEEYEPFYLSSGLYYYFMAKAYDDYFIMRPYLAMYPDGDKEKGLKFLNQLTSSHDVFLRNESKYFLMRIYFNLEEDYDLALTYASSLIEENPNNLIYQLYHIKISDKLNPQTAEKRRVHYEWLVSQNNQLSEKQKKHFVEELDKEE